MTNPIYMTIVVQQPESMDTEEFYLNVRHIRTMVEGLFGSGQVLVQLHREMPTEVHVSTRPEDDRRY